MCCASAPCKALCDDELMWMYNIPQFLKNKNVRIPLSSLGREVLRMPPYLL